MKYILAISGGVDSRVLLDFVVRNVDDFREKNFPNSEFPRDFLVAHFDHGIRGESSKNDAKFVRDLAKKYDVKFVLKNGNLPANASENLAREKRYEFLFSVAKKFENAQIITAHHQDDLLETIAINLIRGTFWRGISPMENYDFRANFSKNRAQILRPFLKFSKFEIANFALENYLDWREDSTNFSAKYFRNRVRNFLDFARENDKKKLLKIYEKQKILRTKIEAEIAKIARKNSTKIAPNKTKISRYFLTMIDENSAIEILRFLTRGKLTRPEISRILRFAKTARAHKKLEFRAIKIRAGKSEIVVKSTKSKI